jgi:hypothetical protein
LIRVLQHVTFESNGKLGTDSGLAADQCRVMMMMMMMMIYTFPIRRSGVCIDQTVNKVPPLSSILSQCLPC